MASPFVDASLVGYRRALLAALVCSDLLIGYRAKRTSYVLLRLTLSPQPPPHSAFGWGGGAEGRCGFRLTRLSQSVIL